MSKRNKKRLTRRQQEIRRKRLKKRRRRRRLVIILELIILCILGTTAFGLFKLGKMERTNLSNIKNNGLKQTGYTNVALFGLDSREKNLGKGNRTDTIMIASINNETKKVKLVSVYRDTMLKQNGEHYDKANAAYSVGGPETAVNMLNENLDLNIQDYVSVNFLALADVIDMVDGITVKLTDEEVVHMNNYCVETSKVTGKKYKKIEPAVAGTYKLNGVQAVSYARIRYTAGGDYKRTERQRLVLKKTADKLKQQDLATLNKIIDKVMPEVSTSFTTKEILSLATGSFDYELGETTGFPFDLETPEQIPGYSGSYVIPKGLEENVIKLHQFLYPNKDYTPTATVTDISNTLNDMTNVYPNTTESGTSQNE
mgnify:FL=1